MKCIHFGFRHVKKKFTSYLTRAMDCSKNFLPVLAALLFMLGVLLLCSSPYYEGSNHINAGAALFTAAAFMYNTYIFKSSSNEKCSEFYLKQIISNFNKALDLFSAEDNSNIRWHHAIDNLITGVNLSRKLNRTEHREIFVLDCRNIYYQIVMILGKIENCRFFIGVKNYQTISDAKFFDTLSFFPSPTTSPEYVSALCLFLIRVFCINNNSGLELKASYDSVSSLLKLELLTANDLNNNFYKASPFKILLDYLGLCALDPTERYRFKNF